MYYNYHVNIDTKLGIIGIIFALISLFITINISKSQEKQLCELEDIGIKTRETTEALQTSSAIQKNRSDFFIRKNINDKYKLIFPVGYEGKTLPLINAADSYAMHVISDHLGVDGVDLQPIPRNSPKDYMNSEYFKCNSILMCDVNPALKQLFKYNESNAAYQSNPDKFPAWFEEYDTDPSYCSGKTICIAVYDNVNNIYLKLKSPSEDCCTKASKYDKDVVFEPEQEVQSDYGIFARITKGEYKYIILAGIHGYGTWIVASFLNNLLYGKYKDEDNYNEIFFGEKDFIAVIYGFFNTKKLFVDNERIGIFQKLWWTKDSSSSSEWKQIL